MLQASTPLELNHPRDAREAIKLLDGELQKIKQEIKANQKSPNVSALKAKRDEIKAHIGKLKKVATGIDTSAIHSAANDTTPNTAADGEQPKQPAIDSAAKQEVAQLATQILGKWRAEQARA